MKLEYEIPQHTISFGPQLNTQHKEIVCTLYRGDIQEWTKKEIELLG